MVATHRIEARFPSHSMLKSNATSGRVAGLWTVIVAFPGLLFRDAAFRLPRMAVQRDQNHEARPRTPRKKPGPVRGPISTCRRGGRQHLPEGNTLCTV